MGSTQGQKWGLVGTISIGDFTDGDGGGTTYNAMPYVHTVPAFALGPISLLSPTHQEVTYLSTPTYSRIRLRAHLLSLGYFLSHWETPWIFQRPDILKHRRA
jgi:hypothetical protein